MTFYWWSHWFWITVMSNLIFPQIVVVHTYPSPEATLEYVSSKQDNGNKLVTKLYTVTWTTDVPKYIKTTTEKSLKLQHIEPTTKSATNDKIIPAPINNNNEAEDDYYYEDDVTEVNLEQMEEEQERIEENAKQSFHKEDHEVDVKRSAEELQTKPILNPKNDLKTSTTLPALEANNYTNFTDDFQTNSTNTTANTLNAESNNSTTTITSSDSTDTNTTTQKATAAFSSSTNSTTQLPQAPATPKIEKGNIDWLNKLPPADVTTDDYGDEPHKIPFTLENVNKPEDLRREESEHRSRKSKGLSADYKISRPISYPPDPKNLLTRSTETRIKENNSSEENNISSERLSLQHPYFMDVSAISAICFTVFGICCTVGTVGIVLYRRRFLNKPQALSEPDSSVYIDDSTMRVSDNSDEMYSLDNDSFLNSLEAMTIQNYWTDTVKHTKL
ncbi:uncharacterized protein ACRADG_007677 isoform 2-T4 [Cochliomyia hominivorax]